MSFAKGEEGKTVEGEGLDAKEGNLTVDGGIQDNLVIDEGKEREEGEGGGDDEEGGGDGGNIVLDSKSFPIGS